MQQLFDQGGEVGALMRDIDWTATALGPPETWPQSLRIVVRIMLTSRYAMWIGWGSELAFLYNDAYARMTLGPKHPWALGRPAREVWAEIWKDVAPRIDQVLSSGQATWDEGLMLFLQRYGYPEETYHTFSYSPLPGDDGRIAGNFCVVTEETDRIIGERRLDALRELASMLAGANTAREVYLAIESCGPATARDIPFALLYALDEASGRATLAARSGITEQHPAAPGETAIDGDAPWPFREVLEGSGEAIVDGDAAWPCGPWDIPAARAVVVPISLQGQARPSHVFVAAHNPYRPLDESARSFLRLFVGQIAAGLEKARAYEEERQRVEALAALDRAKTAFFSNVSHEFRTPLTLMLGPTEDALSRDGVMRRAELETVYRNELRLLKLVNSLLDFSRAEAGRTQAMYEPLDLAALTTDLASTFRSAIERGGLELAVDCAPLPQPVFVDRHMWEKIVLNLLSNAFKFTLEGAIRVALRPAGDAVVLTVQDTGVGIPQSELTRVFERFQRIEGSRARTHEGSGIGLALVRDLVALHGGRISVASLPGAGTTFTVTIPFGSGHLPAERIGQAPSVPVTAIGAPAFVAEAERWLETPDSSTAPGVADESPVDTAAPERGRILVADDNADMRAYLRRLLSPRWSVETAANGRDALERMRRRRADLVIADVMMPELDGFALLAALRGDEATRDVPVLILSARAGEEMRLEGLQAGADDYLVKPFSARELIARVETLLIRASMRAVENLQRRQLADVFRQVPAAMAILRGPTHVFELANPAYLALVGKRPIVGRPVREALPELEGQGVYELLDDVYASGQPHVGNALRLMIERTSGQPEELFFDFVYQPMRDATQQVDGIAVVVFEVSELVRARRDAESASRTKDEFLAMLGHELRNPLAPILTALQLMRLRGDSMLDHERTVIERQTRHLVRLVDDLLDVSRIARGKIELRRERLDVADAVAKAIEMASPLLEERQHRLDVLVPRGLTVIADPARLAQILANLLTNAAKYTDAAGRITVKASLDDGIVSLRVADTGIGMDPQMLPLVFDMFTQERQTLDRTAGGLGLGLTIVRNLVQLHGGTVEARSEGRGKGSEFIVRLPAAPAADTGIAAVHDTPSAREHLDGIPVLVVDDNADAADMLRAYVGSLGYRVTVALDSLAALRAADENRPAIALLDIGLPVMDGFELARRFRESDRHGRMKLVAITGYGQETDRQRSRDAGFDAHLVKPVDMDQLEHLLSTLSSDLRN